MIRINGGQATLGANTFTGAQVAPSLALGGAALSGNALAVTGTIAADGGASGGGLTYSAGSLTAATFVRGISYVQSATIIPDATGSILFGGGGGRASIKSSATGVIQVGLNAGTTGVSFDAATDGTLKLNNFANSAGAIVQAASLALGGAALVGNALAVTGTTLFTGNVDSTGYTNTSTAFQAAAGGSFYWNARALMASPSDGVIKLSNNGQTDFTRLQFGGTTNFFPAIARNGTSLDLKLADNSGYCAMTLHSLLITDNTNILRSTASMANGAGVSAGTLTNAPAAGNPTKWFAFNDNGTTRYIPAW